MVSMYMYVAYHLYIEMTCVLLFIIIHNIILILHFQVTVEYPEVQALVVYLWIKQLLEDKSAYIILLLFIYLFIYLLISLLDQHVITNS